MKCRDLQPLAQAMPKTITDTRKRAEIERLDITIGTILRPQAHSLPSISLALALIFAGSFIIAALDNRPPVLRLGRVAGLNAVYVRFKRSQTAAEPTCFFIALQRLAHVGFDVRALDG